MQYEHRIFTVNNITGLADIDLAAKVLLIFIAIYRI